MLDDGKCRKKYEAGKGDRKCQKVATILDRVAIFGVIEKVVFG